MAFSLSGGVSNTKDKNTEVLDYEELLKAYKESQSNSESETAGITVNSGRTDTGKNTTNTTNNNTTVNSGSTNTSGTAASTNSVENSGSTNTTNIGGSYSTTYNSGRTDSVQTILSQEAVDHLTRGILESTQGLAAVSSGQKMNGLYDSTANTLLTNDLLSRTAGEVAVRGAKTVTTIGASHSSTFNSGSTNTEKIGGSRTTQNIGATSGFQNIGGNTSTSSGTSSSIVDTLLNVGESSSTNASKTKGTVNSVDTAETLTSGSKVKEGESSQTTKGGKAGWIVCGELYKQNRMPREFYLPGLRAFNQYNGTIKKGYYYWAVPAVAHLKAHPQSKRSRFLDVMLNARAEYLAAEAGVIHARKTKLGWISKQLVWGCWLLGKTVARNYKVNRHIFGVQNGY
jgi:hypothetical protein